MAGCMLLDHQWWLRSGESLSPDAKSVRSREAGPPGEIPSMPLPTVDKEFLPSDLLKLPRSPNVDGPKKPFVGLGASEIHRSVGSPRSGLSRTSGPGLSLLSHNRQCHHQ